MSIQFLHMKVPCCPTCGDNTVVEESIGTTALYSRDVPEIREHCNGQRWESRKFLCGCTVEWVPNFRRAEVTKVCPRHPALLELLKEEAAIFDEERALKARRDDLNKRRIEVVRNVRV
jgi:hypothetical protein